MAHRLKQRRASIALRRRAAAAREVTHDELAAFMRKQVENEKRGTDSILHQLAEDRFHREIFDELRSARRATMATLIGIVAYVAWGLISRIFL